VALEILDKDLEVLALIGCELGANDHWPLGHRAFFIA